MGERKGQNHYYPPDFNWKTHGNLNRYHGTHALRERASKIHLGILRIRFEMPFNVWCEGCENHIGMGVRYNADKKKVGDYYSTPIYEFHMKCHLCDNYFDIRTDPQNFDYECVRGLIRQDKRPINIDGQLSKDRVASQKLATDAMFKLEHGEKDKQKKDAEGPALQRIETRQDRIFYDDFSANQAARRIHRTKKKEVQAQEKVDADLREKSSLGDLPLVAETGEDRKLASMIAKYKTVKGSEEKRCEKRHSINNQSIFAAKPSLDTSANNTKGKKSAVIIAGKYCPSVAKASKKNKILCSKRKRDVGPVDQLRKSLTLSVRAKKRSKAGLTDMTLNLHKDGTLGGLESKADVQAESKNSDMMEHSYSDVMDPSNDDECNGGASTSGISSPNDYVGGAECMDVTPASTGKVDVSVGNAGAVSGSADAAEKGESLDFMAQRKEVKKSYLSTLGDMYGSDDSDRWSGSDDSG